MAGAALFALPSVLIAIPAATVFIAVAAGVAGVGLSVFGTLWETALQHHVPEEVLSRVSAYDWFGSVAFVPLGYIIAGPIAGVIGVRTLLLVSAVWAGISCLAVLFSRSVREVRSEPAIEAADAAR